MSSELSWVLGSPSPNPHKEQIFDETGGNVCLSVHCASALIPNAALNFGFVESTFLFIEIAVISRTRARAEDDKRHTFETLSKGMQRFL